MQLCQKKREFRAPPPKCLTFLRTTLTKMIVRQNDRLALQENEIHQNDRSFCRKATVHTYQAINFRNPPLKVRAAGFLPGVLLFSDLSFEKFSPGFYFFPKSKNSFAGSYFFLEFSHIVCCFLPFSVYLKAKTLKKIRLRRAGSYCFSKFSASGGVLLFSKIHKKNRLPGFYFF